MAWLISKSCHGDEILVKAVRYLMYLVKSSNGMGKMDKDHDTAPCLCTTTNIIAITLLARNYSLCLLKSKRVSICLGAGNTNIRSVAKTG